MLMLFVYLVVGVIVSPIVLAAVVGLYFTVLGIIVAVLVPVIGFLTAYRAILNR